MASSWGHILFNKRLRFNGGTEGEIFRQSDERTSHRFGLDLLGMQASEEFRDCHLPAPLSPASPGG